MKMRNLKLALGSLVLLFALIGQVDAARLGSGKNAGRTPSTPMQRQATPAPAAKPAQVAPAPTPAAAPAAAPSRFGGFGGILGGLAAGIGLGYLFSHLGMGEMGSGIASLITGILIALLVGMVVLFVLRRFVPAFSKSNAAATGMQRNGYGATPQQQEPTFAPMANAPQVEAQLAEVPLDLPPGFDEHSFLENAKQYLGIEISAGSYLCSVQFSGLIREQVGAEANAFSEIWNLSKPVEGPGGWVLAGIQQVI